MAAAGDPDGGGPLRGPLADPPADPTLLAVLAVAAAALALRLAALGGRVFHWDEGRVGYWIVRYHETGQFHYRPIIHGPFLPIVNDYVFAVLPATDASARLPVALVGGLLPLVAWLFRDRLDPAETVALALVLAFNPLLVYYSRFMRSDVLVGGFALLGLGLIVRAVDARRPGHLVAAGAAFGLSVTAKENALLYGLCYLGAGALLVEHRLVRRIWRGTSPRAAVVAGLAGAAGRLRRWVAAGAAGEGIAGDGAGGVRRNRRLLATALSPPGAAVAFLTVAVFFYAPRPALWEAFADPARFPGVLDAALVESWERFYQVWAADAGGAHDYLPFLHDLLVALSAGAPLVLLAAPLGLAVDGYGTGRYRELLAFGTYVGAAGLLGYPVATDIQAPWIGVHVVLPLSLPAAAGLAYVWREVRATVRGDDAVAAALAVLLVVAVAGGVAALNADYFNAASEEDEAVVQWAQPHNDLRASLDRAETVARHNAGTDVLFWGTTTRYGDRTLLYVANESSLRQPPAGGPAWHSRLPIPWYLERSGAVVDSTPPGADPDRALSDPPPVVIAHPWDRDELDPHLAGYAVREHGFKLWGETVVVYVDRSALAAARGEG